MQTGHARAQVIVVTAEQRCGVLRAEPGWQWKRLRKIANRADGLAAQQHGGICALADEGARHVHEQRCLPGTVGADHRNGGGQRGSDLTGAQYDAAAAPYVIMTEHERHAWRPIAERASNTA